MGEAVSGTYGTEGGRVWGTLDGAVLEGFWSEEQGQPPCSEPRGGRWSWGRVRLTFVGDSFDGSWSFCADDPAGGRPWTGTRVARASRPLVDVSGRWNSSEGELVLEQDGTFVRGTYGTRDGRISGTLDGNVLTGSWSESGGGSRCAPDASGRTRRGQLRLVFEGSAFHGGWTWCEEPPVAGAPWTGWR